MKVSIVVGAPGEERQVDLEVPAGTTVEAAIRMSALALDPDQEFSALRVGIWNRVVALDQIVRQGDRIEIYRPLTVDPKEGRRLRAELRRRARRPNPR